MAGHLGTKPTQYKIMKNFFWPGMANHIKRACQSCERCQKTAKRTHSTAPMQITTTFTEPFHRVALDIVGPLPHTKRKHMYILTYIDLASRYPDQAVAETLLRILSRLSIPLEVLTDRGSNFISSFMHEVYKFLGVKHIKTAPFGP